jgi:FtsP/CotA-like multicopper oxidase with cupredoxin domain
MRRRRLRPPGMDATAHRTQLVELADGTTYDLDIAPVTKRIGDATVEMLAYNGSIPGPTLKVAQGSTVRVRVTNRTPAETTVHWHGVRLANRFDGTHETQAPIAPGDSFTYEVSFPDPGAYWYHPHIREDVGQELGLYGNIIVVPADAAYWPAVHREIAVTLDDILIEDGRVARFDPSTPDHVAMGRFGNTMLIAGEADLRLDARRGEIVRFYFTNTANTRVFNVRLPGAVMKLVGGDAGRYEREELVQSVLLAPSERAVVDVLFPTAGRADIEHRTPERAYRLGTIAVAAQAATPTFAFHTIRTAPEMQAERARIARYLDAEPDRTLSFVAEMDLGGLPSSGAAQASGHHGHAHHAHHAHPAHHVAPKEPTIEWEDDMVEVNRRTTPANTRWKLVDTATGASNHAIDWRFRVGDLVKLRLVNDGESDHPMPHPFHIHGAGRFLILRRNGLVEPNLVWKDTVLVRTNEVIEILLEVTNPGVWMAHCHIAEHHEAGMMLRFVVDEAA